jgi:hypothetical protein
MTERPEIQETDALQTLWQGQPQESETMTLQAMRMLVRNDRDHVRQILLFGFAVIVAEATGFAAMLRVARNDLMRTGEIVVLVGLAWMAWRLWARRPGRAPDADATTQSLIAFQRQALVRRRGNYVWLLLSSAPVLIGAVLVAVGAFRAQPGAPISRLFPFAAMVGVWLVVAWIVNRRGMRRLQQRIDDLDQMARGG